MFFRELKVLFKMAASLDAIGVLGLVEKVLHEEDGEVVSDSGGPDEQGQGGVQEGLGVGQHAVPLSV